MLATRTALNTLRRYIKPDGLLVMTIRPVEIWGIPEFSETANVDRAALVQEFERTGFAFLANPHMQADGEAVYGATAIAPEWITRNFPNWRIARRDRGEDHLQVILVLQPC